MLVLALQGILYRSILIVPFCTKSRYTILEEK
jgi:hypothetical protein